MTQSEQLERGTSMSLLKEPPTQASHNDYRRAPGGRIQRRGDSTYAYDAQGRLISKRTERKGFRPQKWHYQWDGEDQLRRVTTPDDAVWDYHYDPFGRRIGKACVQPGNKRHRQAQKLSYIVTDYLGTPKELLSEEGELHWSASHKLWGGIAQVQAGSGRAANDADGKFTCLLRFQGHSHLA